MPKYKISKSNLREFLSFFGKKQKPKKLQDLIDNDPKLKAIDAAIKKIDDKYGDYSKETADLLKKYNL